MIVERESGIDNSAAESATQAVQGASERRRVWCQKWLPLERAVVEARALACGLTPSRFVVVTALGAVPKARPGATASLAIRELGKIGTELRYLRQSTIVAQDAERLRRLDEVLDQVLHLVGELASRRPEQR